MFRNIDRRMSLHATGSSRLVSTSFRLTCLPRFCYKLFSRGWVTQHKYLLFRAIPSRLLACYRQRFGRNRSSRPNIARLTKFYERGARGDAASIRLVPQGLCRCGMPSTPGGMRGGGRSLSVSRPQGVAFPTPGGVRGARRLYPSHVRRAWQALQLLDPGAWSACIFTHWRHSTLSNGPS